MSATPVTPAWLAEAHARLRARLPGHRARLLAALEPVRVHVERERLASHEDVLARLRAFGPASGWIEWQSALQAFEGGWEGPPEGAGRMLACECADGGGASLHVRWDGAGWTLARIAEAEGEPTHLRERVRHVATARAGGRGRLLCHDRYWAVDPELGARPALARFTGFATAGEEG